MTAIHQLIVGASAGDAITSMALEMQRNLRRLGPSEIFARFCDPSMDGRVRPMHELPLGRPRDLLLYHSSFGDPTVTDALLRRHDRLGVVFHNVTPAHYFEALDPVFAQGLHWGRQELALLQKRSVLNIADSEFNASEMRQLGYKDVHVLPAGLVPDRLREVTPDTEVTRHLAETYPSGYVVVVAQLLPHKRVDVVLQALHVLQWCLRIPLGLVVVGAGRSAAYTAALHRLARSLRISGVWFTGRLPDSALASVFGNASVYVSASEHEGLGIPPLEAMSFGVPAVVRDAGATRETVADAAMVLPEGAGPLLFAHAVERVLNDPQLRGELSERGLRRVRELGLRSSDGDALTGLVSGVL